MTPHPRRTDLPSYDPHKTLQEFATETTGAIAGLAEQLRALERARARLRPSAPAVAVRYRATAAVLVVLILAAAAVLVAALYLPHLH